MYEWVAEIQEPRLLAELVSRCSPRVGAEGYASTDFPATRDVFGPRMASQFGDPERWAHCSVAMIMPNGTIPPHADSLVGSHRYMVVLQTNDRAWCLHGGAWQQLREGGIYTADPRIEHAALNWGREPRIHFVVDVI